MSKEDKIHQQPSLEKTNDDIYFDTPILRVLRNHRDGKFFTIEGLQAIDFSEHIGDEGLILIADETRRIFVNRIELFGEDTIAHLCLRLIYLRALESILNIYTISELEERVSASTLQFDLHRPGGSFPMTYQNSIDEIGKTLKDWKAISR